jgi:transposase
MRAEEELIQLREEKRELREQAQVQQETISQQGELILRQQETISQQGELILRQQERMTWLERELSGQQEQLSQFTTQVKALQERLRKDSHNSHLPPSSDRFSRQPKSLRKKSGKPSGGQEGHGGSTLRFSPCPDEVLLHAVERCEHCQADLRQVPVSRVERRQVVEVPPSRLVVQEHQSEQKQCPQCQQLTSAPFPAEVRAPVQYGPRIGALAVYLVEYQLLPLARACELMEDVLAVSMSQGTLGDLLSRCARNLAQVEQQIKAALIASEVIHQDETGVHVAGHRQWLHVTATASLTHYAVHASRGQEALKAIGILTNFRGTSVHDGLASYFLYAACVHALCNVHVLRELTFLAEEQGLWWAAKLKALLLSMKEATGQAREQGKRQLEPLEVIDWEAGFLALLAEGELAHPRAPTPLGSRGPGKQSPGRNLLDHLRKHQAAVLAFLEDLRVPFDNNQAERDLRMAKVQQKISGCFRSWQGAHLFARIRGYLSTLRKQGVPLLAALEATLLGHPVLPSL